MGGTRTQTFALWLQHLQVVIRALGFAACLHGEVEKNIALMWLTINVGTCCVHINQRTTINVYELARPIQGANPIVYIDRETVWKNNLHRAICHTRLDDLSLNYHVHCVNIPMNYSACTHQYSMPRWIFKAWLSIIAVCLHANMHVSHACKPEWTTTVMADCIIRSYHGPGYCWVCSTM